jgi:hypothetical protein
VESLWKATWNFLTQVKQFKGNATKY